MWARSRFRCLVLSSFFISFSFSPFSLFPPLPLFPFPHSTPFPSFLLFSFSLLSPRLLYPFTRLQLHSVYRCPSPPLSTFLPNSRFTFPNLLNLLICMPGNITKVNTFKRKDSLHVSLQLPMIMSLLILLVPQMAWLAQPWSPRSQSWIPPFSFLHTPLAAMAWRVCLLIVWSHCKNISSSPHSPLCIVAVSF